MSPVQEFLEALAPQLDFGDRVIKISRGALGGDSAFINFYTLPQAVYDRREGGGAEAENNRISFIVRSKGDKVTVETSVLHIGDFRDNKKLSLRKKTGTPEAIAKYLGAHINKIAAEVAPKFTHTKGFGGFDFTEEEMESYLRSSTKVYPDGEYIGGLRMLFEAAGRNPPGSAERIKFKEFSKVAKKMWPHIKLFRVA